MPRLLKLIDKTNFNELTRYDKKKVKDLIQVKTDAQLIEVAKLYGLDVGTKKRNQLIRTYKYFVKFYNKEAKKTNKEILIAREAIRKEKAKARREAKKLFDYEIKIEKYIKNKNYDNMKFTELNIDKLKIVIKLLSESGRRYIIKIGDKVYTLTEKLIDILTKTADYSEAGSDAEIIDYINDFSEMIVEKVKKQEKHKQGSFFKYEHLIKGLNLDELQIYKKFKAKKYKENCFIKSLIGQVDETIINDCKMIIKGKKTTLKDINIICEKHDLHIAVKVDDNHIRHYNKDGNIKVKICLLDEHYFKYMTVPITSYAIKNYFDICDKNNWKDIFLKEKNKYKRSKDRYIDSFKLVKLLLEHKDTLLKPIEKNDELYKTCYFDDITTIGSLEYNTNDKNNNKPYEEKKDKKDYINVFFDFETKTNGEKHIPYLCCVKSEEFKKSYYGPECGLYMLLGLRKHFGQEACIKLIAHNITYDLKFIFDYLYNVSFIQRGNKIMSGKGQFYKMKIKLQDSYSLISSKLASFGSMFGFEQEKEFIPYDMYNKENERYVDIKKIKIYTDYQVKCNNLGKKYDDKLNDEYYKQFIENCKKWGCLKFNKIDIIKYSEIYCEIDCEILEKGYNKFKSMIQDNCGLNIDKFVSIASVADAYMNINGVYDDVYKLSGVPREFIQKCVVGGRTMTSQNKKHYVKGKIDDFDAVSLYPSAMSRLEGYLKGLPKILTTTDYNVIKNYDGFFVECKVVKVNNKRNFPLLSFVNDEGVRIFSNEMEGKIVYLDKISYEDCVNFQDIELEIIRGYYYDEGRNYKLKETIEFMFNERLRLKKEGNPLQNVYKLLMNSSYGKTILKPIDEQINYFQNEEKWKKSILANYSFIKECGIIGNKFYIKKMKAINDHYNNAVCGVEVLSMSKRIMNEVMTLAEDNKYNIYYQDTDSMHIDSDKVKLLSDKYKEKYNKELIGKKMNQFHTDFDSDILKGDLYAKESIFLGKKCYLDVLTDDSGEIDYHVRMKGISTTSVKHHSKIDFDGDILKLYKKLYNGDEYTFDLTCNNMKSCFDVVNMNTIRTKECFNRTVKF